METVKGVWTIDMIYVYRKYFSSEYIYSMLGPLTLSKLQFWIHREICWFKFATMVSRMIRWTQKWGYKWHLSVSFWENATFVFWLSQNSWFWVWKKFFSKAIFHKNHFAYYVSRPFLHQKALKQSIWSIWLFVATMLWLQKANYQKHSVWVVSSAKMVLTHI